MPSPNAGQRAPAGEHVERRPLLGDERGAAAGEHRHARAELDLLRARAAAYVRPSTGSGAGPLMRSDSQSESKPWRFDALGQRFWSG